MNALPINRVSFWALTVLSLTALLTVTLGAVLPVVLTGHVPPPASDEGTGAHIFQLSIAGLLPAGMVFLATAKWTKPLRIVRTLSIPTVATLLAFVLLYYFEHVR